MPKVVIGFETNKEFKERVIKAGKNFKIDGIASPVSLSLFCRIAIARLLNENGIGTNQKEAK